MSQLHVERVNVFRLVGEKVPEGPSGAQNAFSNLRATTGSDLSGQIGLHYPDGNRFFAGLVLDWKNCIDGLERLETACGDYAVGVVNDWPNNTEAINPALLRLEQLAEAAGRVVLPQPRVGVYKEVGGLLLLLPLANV